MVNKGTDAQVLCSPGEVLSSGKRTALSWNRCLEGLDLGCCVCCSEDMGWRSEGWPRECS